MKALTLPLAIGACFLATPAAAEDTRSVNITGTAEAFCSLPTNWQVASSTNNVTASQFTGNTWTIPPALLADDTGAGVVSSTEVAIRVRGQAVCNTTHTITMTSSNGGLANASASSTAPGFQSTRKMIYNANWRDQPTWGIVNWVPATPGASITYDHGSRVPPGVRDFDVRMGLVRDPTAGPMIAGSYTDRLTITISIPG